MLSPTRFPFSFHSRVVVISFLVESLESREIYIFLCSFIPFLPFSYFELFKYILFNPCYFFSHFSLYLLKLFIPFAWFFREEIGNFLQIYFLVVFTRQQSPSIARLNLITLIVDVSNFLRTILRAKSMPMEQYPPSSYARIRFRCTRSRDRRSIEVRACINYENVSISCTRYPPFNHRDARDIHRGEGVQEFDGTNDALWLD